MLGGRQCASACLMKGLCLRLRGLPRPRKASSLQLYQDESAVILGCMPLSSSCSWLALPRATQVQRLRASGWRGRSWGQGGMQASAGQETNPGPPTLTGARSSPGRPLRPGREAVHLEEQHRDSRQTEQDEVLVRDRDREPVSFRASRRSGRSIAPLANPASSSAVSCGPHMASPCEPPGGAGILLRGASALLVPVERVAGRPRHADPGPSHAASPGQQAGSPAPGPRSPFAPPRPSGPVRASLWPPTSLPLFPLQ